MQETTRTSTIVIRVDWENNSEQWWEAAEESGNCPIELAMLASSSTTADRAIVTGDAGKIASIKQWCEGLPGWNSPDAPGSAPHPLVIETVDAEYGDKVHTESGAFVVFDARVHSGKPAAFDSLFGHKPWHYEPDDGKYWGGVYSDGFATRAEALEAAEAWEEQATCEEQA